MFHHVRNKPFEVIDLKIGVSVKLDQLYLCVTDLIQSGLRKTPISFDTELHVGTCCGVLRAVLVR